MEVAQKINNRTTMGSSNLTFRHQILGNESCSEKVRALPSSLQHHKQSQDMIQSQDMMRPQPTKPSTDRWWWRVCGISVHTHTHTQSKERGNPSPQMKEGIHTQTALEENIRKEIPHREEILLIFARRSAGLSFPKYKESPFS